MADVSSTFSSLSSTEANNAPAGTTAIGTNLDDNLRMIQAHMAAWRDAMGWGILNLSSVAGTNTVTATLAATGDVTFGPASLSSGMRFRLIPANSNTGAATVNITTPNSGGVALGAKSVFLNGVALVGYEMRKNCPVILDYDGSQFNLVSGAHGGDGIPLGFSLDGYHANAPAGYLLCDGSAVSRTTYADLFARLSTTYGAGDGSTTFNVPNMARRVPVGSGGSATGTLSNTVGSTGGEEGHTLSASESGAASHAHSGSMSASGSFTYDNLGGNSGTALFVSSGTLSNTGSPTANFPVSVSGSITVNASSAVGASSAHNNMQPSMVVYKVIKV